MALAPDGYVGEGRGLPPGMVDTYWLTVRGGDIAWSGRLPRTSMNGAIRIMNLGWSVIQANTPFDEVEHGLPFKKVLTSRERFQLTYRLEFRRPRL